MGNYKNTALNLLYILSKSIRNYIMYTKDEKKKHFHRWLVWYLYKDSPIKTVSTS